MMTNQKGFLIVDVLIAIMVLAVLFALFMGAMMQSAKVAIKSARMTDAISSFGPILFEVETGLRPDLALYGGEGQLKPDFRYKLIDTSEEEYAAKVKAAVIARNGAELISLDAVVSRSGVQ